MEAIIINRVSAAHQLEGYSLDVQEREGKRYAEEKGLSVLRVFTFQETASKVHQRKKFDEIMAFVASHTSAKQKPLAVVAEKHDRLYRNHSNKAQFQIFLEEGKVEIHLYKERKILTKDSPPSEFLVDDVMTSVNAFTARNIGMASTTITGRVSLMRRHISVRSSASAKSAIVWRESSVRRTWM